MGFDRLPNQPPHCPRRIAVPGSVAPSDQDDPPVGDRLGDRLQRPEVKPHDRPVGSNHEGEQAALTPEFALALGGRLRSRVDQQVDQRGPAGQRGPELLGQGTHLGLGSAEARIEPRQLGLQLVLASGQLGDLLLPGCGLLGFGRGQGEGRQLPDGLLILGKAPCGLGLGIGLSLPPPGAELSLPLEGDRLGGEHMAVHRIGGDLDLRGQREVGIERGAESTGHRQLLALG